MQAALAQLDLDVGDAGFAGILVAVAVLIQPDVVADLAGLDRLLDRDGHLGVEGQAAVGDMGDVRDRAAVERLGRLDGHVEVDA